MLIICLFDYKLKGLLFYVKVFNELIENYGVYNCSRLKKRNWFLVVYFLCYVYFDGFMVYYCKDFGK